VILGALRVEHTPLASRLSFVSAANVTPRGAYAHTKAKPDPTVAHHRARKAGLTRCVNNGERQPDDPEFIDATRELAAAQIANYIRKITAAAPPLSDEQRHQISALLRVGSDG